MPPHSLLIHPDGVGRRVVPLAVHADHHAHRLAAVLVAHLDAVLSGVLHGHVVDGDGAAGGLPGEAVGRAVRELLAVAQPAHRGGRVTVDEARQTQGLTGEKHRGNNTRRASVFTTRGDIDEPLQATQRFLLYIHYLNFLFLLLLFSFQPKA